MSSVVVNVIVLAAVLFVIVVVAILASDTSWKATQSAPSSFVTTRFDPYGLAVAHPRRWTPQSWPVVSSFTSLITYLSPHTLHDPCIRTATSTSCGEPLATLPPRGVLITWENIGYPHASNAPEITNPNTTIGGQSASVTIAHPGDCGRIRADETITADVLRPDGNHYEMTACLRAPGTAANEELVRRMLASVQITQP